MKFLEIAKKFAFLPLILVLIVDFWFISHYGNELKFDDTIQRDSNSDLRMIMIFNGVMIFITFFFTFLFFMAKQVKAGVINLVSMFITITIGIVTIFMIGLSVCGRK